VSIASGAGGDRERGDGRGEAGAAATVAEEAVVPPAPPLPPVQLWLPEFPAYEASVAGLSSGGDDRRRMRSGFDRVICDVELVGG
jgi:hypothetical protein